MHDTSLSQTGIIMMESSHNTTGLQLNQPSFDASLDDTKQTLEKESLETARKKKKKKVKKKRYNNMPEDQAAEQSALETSSIMPPESED